MRSYLKVDFFLEMENEFFEQKLINIRGNKIVLQQKIVKNITV